MEGVLLRASDGHSDLVEEMGQENLHGKPAPLNSWQDLPLEDWD